MWFSYETAKQFFDCFLKHYLHTEDESKIREVKEKAAILCSSRLIHRAYKKSELTEADRAVIARNVKRIFDLSAKHDSLTF